jgi:hypothetical protein
MEWHIVDERPGYLGKHRTEKYAEWNLKYGALNWRLIWKLGVRYLDFMDVCLVYEQAYLIFMSKHMEIVHELVNAARDIYDDSPTNVQSGTNYRSQETDRTHIQDIAIRRVLHQLGMWFKGRELIQIRDAKGTHALSMLLSPGRVPFDNPNMIIKPWLEGWWEPGSVECFYQSNRFLEFRD